MYPGRLNIYLKYVRNLRVKWERKTLYMSSMSCSKNSNESLQIPQYIRGENILHGPLPWGMSNSGLQCQPLLFLHKWYRKFLNSDICDIFQYISIYLLFKKKG